ncbi:Lar family restriction alleviation protein [Enterobacter roggenkampii]
MKLLPCPFCGGEPEEYGGMFFEFYGHERQDYSIACKKCKAEVRCDVGEHEGTDAPCSCHHDTRKICAEKWNRRAAMLQGSDNDESRCTNQAAPALDSSPKIAESRCGNSQVIPDWQTQAEKMAELYGNSFVLFRNGESPQCADPSKVIISFTDEGFGRDSAAPQQEVNNG